MGHDHRICIQGRVLVATSERSKRSDAQDADHHLVPKEAGVGRRHRRLEEGRQGGRGKGEKKKKKKLIMPTCPNMHTMFFHISVVIGIAALVVGSWSRLGEDHVAQCPRAPSVLESTSDDDDDYRRIVFIGDVHGSSDGLREVLQGAGIISDGSGCARLSGDKESTLVVQLGDIVDRGALIARTLLKPPPPHTPLLPLPLSSQAPTPPTRGTASMNSKPRA